MLVDDTVDQVTVEFDIKLASEMDQDKVWIEQKDLGDGVFGLVVEVIRKIETNVALLIREIEWGFSTLSAVY